MNETTLALSLLFQGLAGTCCVVLLITYLLMHRGRWKAGSTLKQLILWYPLSAPWLLVRAPLLYLLVYGAGVPLWAAIVVEFIIERPLFFLTAREIAVRVK